VVVNLETKDRKPAQKLKKPKLRTKLKPENLAYINCDE
jgi:hypothetical protein